MNRGRYSALLTCGMRRTLRPPSSSTTAGGGHFNAVRDSSVVSGPLASRFGFRTFVTDPSFRRAPMATRVGLRGGFAFPVRKGEHMYGVIDFFSRESREPDQEVLDMVADIGIKVGLFVDRKRTEEELRRTEARLVEEQRLAEVARVLGDIGHDLKNMLMPILSGAALLEQELSECFSKLPAACDERHKTQSRSDARTH